MADDPQPNIRLLKAVVIGLGVLILVALGVIVVTVASRLESGKAKLTSTTVQAPHKGTTDYGVKDVTIPPGFRLLSVRVVGLRVLFEIAGPDSKRGLIVYDVDTGKRLGIIQWTTPEQ